METTLIQMIQAGYDTTPKQIAYNNHTYFNQ